MKKKSKSKSSKSNFIIPVVSVAVCSLLALTSIDKKGEDLFLKTQPSLYENPEVLMVKIDDSSVANIGAWPFSRKVYANSLIALREFGADAVVFDLSFLDKSQAKVDESYLTGTLPDYIDSYFENLGETGESYMSAFCDGAIGGEDYADASEAWWQEDYRIRDELKTSVERIMEDADDVFASSIKFSGNVYLAMTMQDLDYDKDGNVTNNEAVVSEEEKAFLESYVAIDNVVSDNDTKTKDVTGMQEGLLEFLSNAAGAGFVNADPDSDGYLRRLQPFVKYDGKYYGQLVLVPVLARMRNPQIVISNKTVKIGDVVIPRSTDGSILIKYPKKKFNEYNSTSLWNIYRLSIEEDNLVNNIQIMDESGFFDMYEGEDNPRELYDAVKYIREELYNGEDPEFGITYEAYAEYLRKFFWSCGKYLNDGNKRFMEYIYPDDKDYVDALFFETRGIYDELMESRNKVEQKVKGAICIFGTCATSTTDYGLNPYEEHYPNPGVHYAFANMLLDRDFVDDSPVWISIIIALVLCLLYELAAYVVKGTGRQIAAGIIFLAVTFLGLLGYFAVTKQYIGISVPLSSLLLSFIVTTAQSFISASREKKFITNAFGQCLAPDVVKEIVENPDSFKLGGVRREMTAIFTDIQKFSGFSELLSADQLVALLNFYLTRMSDAIMSEGGTIDKYEGDAIVSFVGAPVEYADHAERACAAALKMKKEEALLNEEIVKIANQEELSSDNETRWLQEACRILVANKRTLFTRIGLNSGEITAGFMGSSKKKNYTVMGNNVNLASRLEGVNKVYHTGGILISEATKIHLGSRFVLRSLDRVKVVNVNTPIRLYELLAERGETDIKLLQYSEKWEKAMKCFENKDYDNALESFKKLQEEKPEDAVCSHYIDLLETYFIKGQYPVEPNDFGVEYLPEENVFKLLQK